MPKKMLPEKVKVEIKKWCREHPMARVSEIIRYLRTDIATEVDERVASALRARKFQDLPGYRSSSKVHALQAGAEPEAPQGGAPQPESQQSDMAQMMSKVCATLEKFSKQTKEDRGRRQDRRPRSGSKPGSKSQTPRGSRSGSPKFKIPESWPGGCFQCGKKGHSRRGCPEYKAPRKKMGLKPGDKMPSTYEGKFEEHLREHKPKVHPITAAEGGSSSAGEPDGA